MSAPRILIVEDEILSAENIQDILVGFGYDVPGIAVTGEEALQKAEELSPNLVLMDIKLKNSRLDGIETAEQLRALRDVPVIYLTAFADTDTVTRAKVTEPYSYIFKPVNARELHTNIEMALYKHRADARIRHLLQEKEVLLKEVHHRVKNNLQVIQSLLDLQLHKVPESETRHILQESMNRIQSMAIIHEHLYQSADLSDINMANYIERLSDYIFEAYGGVYRGIRLELNAQAVTLGIKLAIPCGLILNELLTNALKYAFPVGSTGIVQITFSRSADEQIALEVRDTGQGLMDEEHFYHSSSLGLQLVKLLTAQLRGTVILDSSQGFGVRIVFPDDDAPRSKEHGTDSRR